MIGRSTTRLALALPMALLAAAPASAIEYDIQRWTLDAGTEVVLVEDHRAPVVHVALEFPVGTWSPWALEHHAEEAFEIQPYDPDGSLRARADRLSVDLSVSMSTHSATLRLSCLRDDLTSALELAQDVLGNSDFDRHELRRWSRAAALQWKGSRKDPGFRLRQASARMLFDADDPRRRGYEKPRPNSTDLEALAAIRDVVVRLPGRAIAFAGDLARPEAERLVAGLLPPAAERPPRELAPILGPMTPVEDLPGEQIVTMPRVKQTFFAYGRHSLTFDDPRYPAFMVADHVLGGHFFSRLYEALRHEGGETYGASTRGGGGVYREGYALTTFTRGDNVEVTEEKLREVLRRFHADGITQEERRAAVGFMLGRRPFSRQSPTQILGRFLWERRHSLPAGFYDDLIDRASQVSLAEINGFVREFYDPAFFHMLKVSPK